MSRESAVANLVNVALERAQLEHRPMFIHCTANDWIIGHRQPDFQRQHIRVDLDPPQATMLEWDVVTGRWSERVISHPAPPPGQGQGGGE